jgi:ribosome-associated translation inhibitor RaiA
MYVEERSIGMPLTPELRSLVRTVWERSFARIAKQVDHAQVRLRLVREGVECRAVLRPHAGATLAASEVRPTMIDAVFASANKLARELQRRYMTKTRRSRRQRVHQRRRDKLAA